MYDAAHALELLYAATGVVGARFHEGQEESIRSLVDRRGRLLVVQRTGWGKSAVYFLAARLLREQGFGPALLISPLLSLMRNQIVAASRMGLRVETIHSENKEEWDDVERALANDTVDMLIVSPERLNNERFQDRVLGTVAERTSLIVIDEAHCISDWGHDFRPDYRRVGRLIEQLPANARLLATTATANDRVLRDLVVVLGSGVEIVRGSLDRPSLQLQTIRMPDQASRMAWIAERLGELQGSGIIYALTVSDADRLSAWLRSRGFAVEAYTSLSENRPALETGLIENRLKALVATTALGMGFDKPDVAFVIHFQSPPSVIAYYQQVGRAGRALSRAYGVLLAGAEDEAIARYFIETAFPTRAEAARVLEALDNAEDGLSKSELQQSLNLRWTRVEKTLQLLSLESPAPLVKDGPRWYRTAARLEESFWERVDRITQLRRDEQGQMSEYVGLKTGHMNFLVAALDGEVGGSHVHIPSLPDTVDPRLVSEARRFLKSSGLAIVPRKQWPAGLGGRILPEHRPETGTALSHWQDSGWGRSVAEGKRALHFNDELAEACASVVREWGLDAAHAWVTCIPSRLRALLVPDLAQRIADLVGLPFAQVFDRRPGYKPQKSMGNSYYQARNVRDSLTLVTNVPPGPVVLIDDIVDSGWTMAVAAWLLRSNGSGKVYPLALASAAPGSP
ncbi:DEAD/DEAH box helicase [bacterium]|nr:DEAD/DEAH box helicase [bacterium]